MVRVGRNDLCPCGSGEKLKRCCGPALDGQPAATPEALMRSRFTAYATGNARYLWRTSHPLYPGLEGETAASFERTTHAWCQKCTYSDLKILSAPPPTGEKGEVHFRCLYTVAGKQTVMEERSVFLHEAVGWQYLGPLESKDVPA